MPTCTPCPTSAPAPALASALQVVLDALLGFRVRPDRFEVVREKLARDFFNMRWVSDSLCHVGILFPIGIRCCRITAREAGARLLQHAVGIRCFLGPAGIGFPKHPVW